MSFFEPRAPAPPPPEEPPQRDWMGPPKHWLGGFVPVRLLIARTEQLAITLGHVSAFTSGVHLQLEVKTRLPTRGTGWILGENGMRLGVVYADGRKWQDAQGWFDGEPVGPLLSPLGGTGSDTHYAQSLWLWPLPPPGPVTFVFAWPELGIAETSVALDGAQLQSAAAVAQQLWDPPGAAEVQAAMRGLQAELAGRGATFGTLVAWREAEPDDPSGR